MVSLFCTCVLCTHGYYQGNFHALVLYGDDAELALAREAVSRINRKAIELEGTCECYCLGRVLAFSVMTQVLGSMGLVRVNAITL